MLMLGIIINQVPLFFPVLPPKKKHKTKTNIYSCTPTLHHTSEPQALQLAIKSVQILFIFSFEAKAAMHYIN